MAACTWPHDGFQFLHGAFPEYQPKAGEPERQEQKKKNHRPRSPTSASGMSCMRMGGSFDMVSASRIS